jgi:hemerythrin-like domain-containing protein
VSNIQQSLQTLTRNFPRRETLQREKGWEGIIDILSAEHSCLLSLLDILRESADKLMPGKVPDYPMLMDIIHYLTYYPDQYHHSRENLVFTRLEQKIPKFKSKLDRLIREHKILADCNLKLLSELEKIDSGRPADRKKLHQNIIRYIDDYEKHIRFEDREVFPLATGDIDLRFWRRLKQKTHFIDDPLFGDDVNFKYYRLEKAIRTSLGDLSHTLRPTEFSPFDLLVKGFTSLAGTPLRVLRSVNPCKSRD